MKFIFYNYLFVLFYLVTSAYTEKSTHTMFHVNKILSNEYLQTAEFSCETDDECQSFILNSKCEQKICKCAGDNILSSDNSKCLPKVEEYGSSCEDNIQCSQLLSTGGVCYNNVCACKTGYHYLKRSCWKSVELHNKCYRNEQCFSDYEYIGLECRNKVCECRTNYYERLKSGCRRIRKAGESCNVDSDCTDQSKCTSMRCSSNAVLTSEDIFYADERQNKSIDSSKEMFRSDNKLPSELGMNCNTDSDCNHIKNAVCLDGFICACQPVLYVASADNKKCLRVAKGKVEDIQKSSCKENPECGVFGGNSFCQDNRCACKNGTYFEKDTSFCWTTKALNEFCEDSRDCNPSTTHADCRKTNSGKFCTCQKGYHQNGLQCLPDALKVGDLCKTNIDCVFPNSFCNDSNVCACKERYYLENGKCIPGVGTPCREDEDCIHLNNTKCKIQNSKTKLCLCLENYTDSKNYKYCLPIANYKEKCVESFQCKFPMGDEGECVNNLCECRENEHYFNGACYKSKFVGESCSSISECFSGGDLNSVICLKGFCSCNYDYELDNSKICVKANSATRTNAYFMSLSFLVFLLTLEALK